MVAADEISKNFTAIFRIIDEKENGERVAGGYGLAARPNDVQFGEFYNFNIYHTYRNFTSLTIQTQLSDVNLEFLPVFNQFLSFFCKRRILRL